ncbi:hypothetical protein HY448_00635 [Candidatus Pacearchaeota archaeon]|nr:hypothetical protein [Candidatus Pacearchaeota archaeon]
MAKKDVQNPQIPSNTNFEKILIENFVSLQKVMTNLSIKFDDLSRQISKLLELFEISAKAIAEKRVGFREADNREISEKISNIAEQNKTIARGLSLLHESSFPRMPQQPMRTPQKDWSQKKPSAPSPETKNEVESGEYTKSGSPYKKDDSNF